MASAALVLAVTGCGGDDEPEAPANRPEGEPTTAGTQTAPPEVTATETEKRDTDTQETAPPSPEDQPGGAGDEEAARVQAAFTGRGGRITPTVVHVPPFIAVRVTLRSADGRGYGLQFPGAQLQAQGRGATADANLDGLRPLKSITGHTSAGGRVRIVADAEPGP
jgi:hypothetical protein